MDVGALLRWYARVKRPLPWRETRDPYALLVSEVMLQQTQAGRVVPYYEAFLARFPDPVALAAAAPSDVLKAWSGLGYNRRAITLQAAAREVVANGWPADLAHLPGVGRYTSAAVGSFAWDRQTAAVDTNVKRVLERHDGIRRRPKAVEERAQSLVPLGQAATFNQAMMELGATVCRPRAPRCHRCPVHHTCAGEPSIAPRRRGADRFEDPDRWARGRILAALVAGDEPPAIEPQRYERALAGLERDGLIVRDPAPRLLD